MNVLVTGGAGFIGSHLCEALLSAGHRVVALDNFDDFYAPRIKRDNLADCGRSGAFTLIEGDIRDSARVPSVLEEYAIHTVVHLAARAGVRPSIERPVLCQDVNVGGTSIMLEAARRNDVDKFIFASSSSVYGNNRKIPFSESDNVDSPISPYAATKKAGELLCHTYHHLYGLNVTCLRFFTVYGPRQRPDLAVHKFARLIEQDRPIPVFGDGSLARDFTYIDDVIEGVTSAIERCRGYAVYNLGSSRSISLSKLIERLEAVLGKRARIERLPLCPGDVERTFADLSLARAKLGYEPRTPLDDGLASFVGWLRGGGWDAVLASTVSQGERAA